MRAARDQARSLGGGDHQQARFGGAVGGREDQQPVLRQAFGQLVHERALVRDMLDHFETGDEIEPAEIERAQFARHVADGEPARFGMKRRRRDVLGRRIDAGDIRAQSRQRFA